MLNLGQYPIKLKLILITVQTKAFFLEAIDSHKKISSGSPRREPVMKASTLVAS